MEKQTLWNHRSDSTRLNLFKLAHTDANVGPATCSKMRSRKIQFPLQTEQGFELCLRLASLLHKAIAVLRKSYTSLLTKTNISRAWNLPRCIGKTLFIVLTTRHQMVVGSPSTTTYHLGYPVPPYPCSMSLVKRHPPHPVWPWLFYTILPNILVLWSGSSRLLSSPAFAAGRAKPPLSLLPHDIQVL